VIKTPITKSAADRVAYHQHQVILRNQDKALTKQLISGRKHSLRSPGIAMVISYAAGFWLGSRSKKVKQVDAQIAVVQPTKSGLLPFLSTLLKLVMLHHNIKLASNKNTSNPNQENPVIVPEQRFRR